MSDQHTILRWVVPRPLHVIKHLPLKYRWEFTRRHPYYVMFWNPADWDFLNTAGEAPLAETVRTQAKLILAQIGVGGDPPIPPEREWSQIEPGEQWSAWTSGAMSRLQIRSIVAALVNSESTETLRSLSDLFREAADLADSDVAGKYRVLRQIVEGKFPGFDNYLPDLIVALNPSSNRKAITDAAMEIISQVRRDEGIPQTRVREDKFDSYLRIWDLREGWSNGMYDHSRGKRLDEIAAETNLGISTVRDHYQAAFRFITGQEYSPPAWFQILGYFHARGLIGRARRVPQRRSGRTRTVSGVRESELTNEANVLSNQPEAQRYIDFDEDREQILAAICNNVPTAQIVHDFELVDSARRLIDDYRRELTKQGEAGPGETSA